jgi:hypothetical protein
VPRCEREGERRFHNRIKSTHLSIVQTSFQCQSVAIVESIQSIDSMSRVESLASGREMVMIRFEVLAQMERH